MPIDWLTARADLTAKKRAKVDGLRLLISAVLPPGLRLLDLGVSPLATHLRDLQYNLRKMAVTTELTPIRRVRCQATWNWLSRQSLPN